MASQQHLIFIGLYHFDDKEKKIIKKQSLDQIEDNDIKEFLRNQEGQGGNGVAKKSYFFKRLDKNPTYIIALSSQYQMNQLSHTLRGIEDHISEHLATELPEVEWKERAIKILLTWNLSEKKQWNEFNQGVEQLDKHFLEWGFIFLAAAVIGYIMMLVMKHII